ncbi:hypothetical protein GCM10022393_21190 [Aquimarina addita]|uniref:Uncharacterized protein n=1 Tax=Aquimarina addita TaxID=870485 RepID=A0ABP6UIE4_9FLAO
MAIAAMIASIRFNDRRNKREAFNGWGNSGKKSKGIKIEPVSEEVLVEIRNKIQRQNRITRIKIMLVIAISILIMTWLLF